jgi:hypothetical protein
MGKMEYCLGLQTDRVGGGIFLHQSTYTRKLLERFNMGDTTNTCKSPMVVISLIPDQDPFRPKEDNEEVLTEEFPYLAAIGALLYLANCSRPGISFTVSVLARHSNAPTTRHWNGIKHCFRYLAGTIDYGLHYGPSYSSTDPIGYADAGYLSDPHQCKSRSGYVFTSGGTAISWRSIKQAIVTTSSNHSEIVALYEASRECIWLRSITNWVNTSTGLKLTMPPTILYEDNAACVHQLKTGFIKGKRTKHIDPKFFFMREKCNEDMRIEKISSSKNIADLFTKSLPSTRHHELCRALGMRRRREFPDRA